MYFSYLSYDSVSEKHEVHTRTSFNNFTYNVSVALFLNLKIMWGGLPSAASVEDVAVS